MYITGTHSKHIENTSNIHCILQEHTVNIHMYITGTHSKHTVDTHSKHTLYITGTHSKYTHVYYRNTQ